MLFSPWWLESDSSFLSPEPSVALIFLRVKAKVLPLAIRPCPAGLAAPTSFPPYSTQTSWKFLQQVKHSPTSGSLHRLCLCLGSVSPRYPDISPISSRFQLKCHNAHMPFLPLLLSGVCILFAAVSNQCPQNNHADNNSHLPEASCVPGPGLGGWGQLRQWDSWFKGREGGGQYE